MLCSTQRFLQPCEGGVDADDWETQFKPGRQDET